MMAANGFFGIGFRLRIGPAGLNGRILDNFFSRDPCPMNEHGGGIDEMIHIKALQFG